MEWTRGTDAQNAAAIWFLIQGPVISVVNITSNNNKQGGINDDKKESITRCY